MNFLPHQLVVLDRARPILEKHGVVVLGLACRLGKSFIALQLANEKAKGREILIVTKKKAISSIQNDAAELGVQCVVTNYESLHKYTGRPAVVVVDEFPCLSAVGKPSLTARAVRAIIDRAKTEYVLMLSATPAIESSAQWANSFWAVNRGPWMEYKSFFRWFDQYGIPCPVRTAGGILRETYKKVLYKVATEVAPFCVTMTQADAGFSVEAQIVVHQVDDAGAAQNFHKRLRDNGLVRFFCGERGEGEGRVVIAESPAAVLQKSAMFCGGTLIDDAGEPLEVEHGGIGLGPNDVGCAKLRYLAAKLRSGVPVAIFTNYIHERVLISRYFTARGWVVTDDLDTFRAGRATMFVGSITSLSKGVDMSWHLGVFVLYSLTFSGEVFYQITQRMNKFSRVDPIKVHVLTIKNSIEAKILAAVSAKQNFNEKFLRGCRT